MLPQVLCREVHMRILLYLIVSIAMFNLCAAKLKTQVIRDEENHSTLYWSPDIETEFDEPDSVKDYDLIALLLDKEVPDSAGDTSLFLMVAFYSEKGIGADPGDTLKLDIDGRTSYLSCIKEDHVHTPLRAILDKPRRPGWLWMKLSYFEINRELLSDMVKGKNVSLDVYLSDRHITGSILKSGQKTVAKFCREYVK